MAEVWYSLGYPAVCINTAMQDLKLLNVPDSNKLVINAGIAGAAKELSIGAEAAEANKDIIIDLLKDKLGDCHINILCTSLGGGSGAGSTEVLVDILSDFGRPVIVIAALPMDNDDAQTKHNALETLSKLSKFVQNKRIHNLIVCDNSKLQLIYSQLSQLDFFPTANRAMVEPLDVFNTYSMLPSIDKSLDSAELLKILIDGEGLSIYGAVDVNDINSETAIAEAIISNLDGNLLASGFDLKQAKYVGVMVIANESTWKKIPNVSVGYGMSMIQDKCGQPMGIFRGSYVSADMPDDIVRVYSMFSGLGLPSTRVESLKKDAQELMGQAKAKNEQRNVTLALDTGHETVNAVQKLKDKIQSKSSAFGKLMGNNVVDRRK